jgi:transposase
VRTGWIAWRDLPGEFGPWQTNWKRHHRFAADGTWDRVLTALQASHQSPFSPTGQQDLQDGKRR